MKKLMLAFIFASTIGLLSNVSEISSDASNTSADLSASDIYYTDSEVLALQKNPKNINEHIKKIFGENSNYQISHPYSGYISLTLRNDNEQIDMSEITKYIGSRLAALGAKDQNIISEDGYYYATATFTYNSVDYPISVTANEMAYWYEIGIHYQYSTQAPNNPDLLMAYHRDLFPAEGITVESHQLGQLIISLPGTDESQKNTAIDLLKTAIQKSGATSDWISYVTADALQPGNISYGETNPNFILEANAFYQYEQNCHNIRALVTMADHKILIDFNYDQGVPNIKRSYIEDLFHSETLKILPPESNDKRNTIRLSCEEKDKEHAIAEIENALSKLGAKSTKFFISGPPTQVSTYGAYDRKIFVYYDMRDGISTFLIEY